MTFEKQISLLSVILVLVCCKPANRDDGSPVIPGPVEDPFALVEGGESVSSIEAVNCRAVARVIGVKLPGESIPDPNATLSRYGMGSTDFGNMWDAGNGSVLAVFGDNFNDKGGDWLSNAAAVSTDRNLLDGLSYDSMIWDETKGKRKELISPAAHSCLSCIPTGGFSLPLLTGTRQYLNYMCIKQWAVDGDNDNWSVYRSCVATSDDFGQNWTDSGLEWHGDSNFAQVAYVVSGGYVYMFGTPSGRHGSVYLARVPDKDVLFKDAYSYWDGSDWSAEELSAAPIANGEVSELTVRYNSYYGRYVMMYLDIAERCLVYRDAILPQGEWSAEKVILDTSGPHVYYGPSIHPWFCDGRDLWFVVSQVSTVDGASYELFHIYLYNAKLREDDSGFNMLFEPGFEQYATKQLSYRTLWTFEGVSSSTDSHSGSVALRIANDIEGEMRLNASQRVCLKVGRNYSLSVWVKSKSGAAGKVFLGVKDGLGNLSSVSASCGAGWEQLKYEFTAVSSIAEVCLGTVGNSGYEVLADDFVLTINE